MKKLLMTGLALIVLSHASFALAEEQAPAEGKANKVQKFDADGDGVLSKAEFVKMHEEKFDAMDSDSDGFLSKEEVVAARKGMHEKVKAQQEKRAEHKASKEEAPASEAPAETPAGTPAQ
jgi:hypothetical protein